MSFDALGLHEVDGILAEHIRSSLLKLLVKAQGETTTRQIEDGLRFLIDQLDGLELAYETYRAQQLLDLEPVNLSELSEQVLHKINTSKQIAR